MAYIHKYKVGDDVFYRVTGKASKPSQNVTLTADEWKGYSSGSTVQNALKFLSSLKFTKEEREKKIEEKQKKVEEKSVEKKPVKIMPVKFKKMASSVIDNFLKAE